jgi:environmental stress-induced protein Ves
VIQTFDTHAIAPSPWKNGGGSTREIVCWPPGAGLDHFVWRASIATIAASGPFSRFAGVDRQIMLLEGDGVALQGDGLAHQLRQPDQAFGFSGDLSIGATLLGGASKDFNLMTRRALCSASLRVCRHQQSLNPSQHGVLLCLDGLWTIDGAGTGRRTLAPHQGLWWANTLLSWQLRSTLAQGRLLVAQMNPHPQALPNH